MKKLITVFACVVGMLLTATTAQAQIDFGVKGGLNVTNMSLSNDVLDASNRAGFFFGPTVKFTLPIVGLGVDASALYDQRSAKVENAGKEDKTIKQQQIAFPVNLRYGFGLGDVPASISLVVRNGASMLVTRTSSGQIRRAMSFVSPISASILVQVLCLPPICSCQPTTILLAARLPM